MSFVKVKNHGSGVKTILVAGKQHFIEANKIAALRPEIADAFVKTHPDTCRVVQLKLTQQTILDGNNKTIWLANMTGDPDCPKKVPTKYFDNVTKRWQKTDVDNPLIEERAVVRKHRGGMVEGRDKAGTAIAYNTCSTTYTIDPYQRSEFPLVIGNWMLNRDRRAESKGSICKSRAPGELDSNIHTWATSKLAALVRYADPMCRKKVNTEESINKAYKGKEKLTKPALELKLYLEREIWLKRVHFRLADPKYDLPSLFEFEQWYAESLKPSTESSETSS